CMRGRDSATANFFDYW
nr:immunoglobulin heavy chain junction region [Macaca mulatta]MOV45712.1 immunoglobulin heavy chain junction region [Macaca mulatta]